jgi:hypothetical protein
MTPENVSAPAFSGINETKTSLMKFMKRLYEGRLNRIYRAYVYWGQCRKSRSLARSLRKILIARKGFSSVSRNDLKRMKDYCRRQFGSASYWPWLATYAEVRGKYIDGWLPNDYYLYKAIPMLNPVRTAHISLVKSLDYRLFGDICVKPVLIVIDHLLYNGDYQPVSREKAEELLKEAGDELVVKGDGGSGGHDVVFKTTPEISLDFLAGRGRYVIQPLVKQHRDLSDIYPGSVNTIRVYTYFDTNSRVTVRAILLLIGAGGRRVNNVSSGGRFLCIGEDGRPVTSAWFAVDDVPYEEHVHPDTGYKYADIRVPSVKKMINMCIKAHYRYPYAGFVGWDCFVDPSGEPLLLEWNAKVPTFRFIEAIVGPCFDVDELVKRVSLSE